MVLNIRKCTVSVYLGDRLDDGCILVVKGEIGGNSSAINLIAEGSVCVLLVSQLGS